MQKAPDGLLKKLSTGKTGNFKNGMFKINSILFAFSSTSIAE